MASGRASQGTLLGALPSAQAAVGDSMSRTQLFFFPSAVDGFCIGIWGLLSWGRVLFAHVVMASFPTTLHQPSCGTRFGASCLRGEAPCRALASPVPQPLLAMGAEKAGGPLGRMSPQVLCPGVGRLYPDLAPAPDLGREHAGLSPGSTEPCWLVFSFSPGRSSEASEDPHLELVKSSLPVGRLHTCPAVVSYNAVRTPL